MPISRDTTLVEFVFSSQEQIDFVLKRNFEGTLNRSSLQEYLEHNRSRIFSHVWRIYAYKRDEIMAMMPKSKSPDTWLRKPYSPGVTPLSLP